MFSPLAEFVRHAPSHIGACLSAGHPLGGIDPVGGHTMRYDDIAAYMYSADIYCPAHMAEIARTLEHPHVFTARGLDASATPEQVLDALAEAWNIDREAEETFDSDQFPKVILYGTIERREYCGRGHVIEGTEDLGDPDSE
jgi:hypothetical protein